MDFSDFMDALGPVDLLKGYRFTRVALSSESPERYIDAVMRRIGSSLAPDIPHDIIVARLEALQQMYLEAYMERFYEDHRDN